MKLEREASDREVAWKAELLALDLKLKADVVEATRLQSVESARLAAEASQKAAGKAAAGKVDKAKAASA